MMIFRSRRFILNLVSVLLLLLFWPVATMAQVAGSAHQGGDVAKRIALAEKIVKQAPVAVDVTKAVEQIVALAPPDSQAEVRETLLEILKPKALERAAVDAYVEVYTAEELTAISEFYATPAGVSAMGKAGAFNQKIIAEIVRLMDKAQADGAFTKHK